VNKITYYRWRQEYCGMKLEQANRLKKLKGDETTARADQPLLGRLLP
jgi:hypothetical protein